MSQRPRLDAIANALRDLWATVDADDLPDPHPATCTEACIAEAKRLIGVAARDDANPQERTDAASQAARLIYAHKLSVIDVASGEAVKIEDVE